MLNINPPPDEPLPGAPFLRYFSASWHIVNVPTESISITAGNKRNKYKLSSDLDKSNTYFLNKSYSCPKKSTNNLGETLLLHFPKLTFSSYLPELRHKTNQVPIHDFFGLIHIILFIQTIVQCVLQNTNLFEIH